MSGFQDGYLANTTIAKGKAKSGKAAKVAKAAKAAKSAKAQKSLFSNPIGLAIDNTSSVNITYLFVADSGNNAIRRISLDGSSYPVITIARSPLLGNPYGLAFDHVNRDLYVTSYSGQRVLRLSIPSSDNPYTITRTSLNYYAGSAEGKM